MHKVIFMANSMSEIDALCWECGFQKTTSESPTIEDLQAAVKEHDSQE